MNDEYPLIAIIVLLSFLFIPLGRRCQHKVFKIFWTLLYFDIAFPIIVWGGFLTPLPIGWSILTFFFWVCTFFVTIAAIVVADKIAQEEKKRAENNSKKKR